MKKLRFLLLFFPVALAAEIFHWGDLIVFATAALAIIPIAGILGEATEVLAEKTGHWASSIYRARSKRLPGDAANFRNIHI